MQAMDFEINLDFLDVELEWVLIKFVLEWARFRKIKARIRVTINKVKYNEYNYILAQKRIELYLVIDDKV